MDRLDIVVEDIREMRATVGEIRDLVIKNSAILEQNTRDIAHHIKRTDALQEHVDDVKALIKAGKLLAKIALGLIATGGGFGALAHFLEWL